jgi:4-diphosphocytidyl-2-C-methyl-D-erythritol kinase
MKIRTTVYGKLNLTLDVLGKSGGYHELSSLCTSVDVCDEITVQKRTDGAIVLSCPGVDCPPQENNAYRAAQAFIAAFPIAQTGVAITVKKGIPVGGGMGGSSADVVGTLLSMQQLFGVEQSVTPLINSLTSDGAFMERGGTGVLAGRGERVEFLPHVPLFFVLVPQTEGVSARECFALCDQTPPQTSTTNQAVAALLVGDVAALSLAVKNHLTPAASLLVPSIKAALSAIEKTQPLAASMTGSGSVTFGVYETLSNAQAALKALKTAYPAAQIATSLPCGTTVEELN